MEYIFLLQHYQHDLYISSILQRWKCVCSISDISKWWFSIPHKGSVVSRTQLNWDTTCGLYRFSAFWLISKCSICSYQLNVWYGGHVLFPKEDCKWADCNDCKWADVKSLFLSKLWTLNKKVWRSLASFLMDTYLLWSVIIRCAKWRLTLALLFGSQGDCRRWFHAFCLGFDYKKYLLLAQREFWQCNRHDCKKRWRLVWPIATSGKAIMGGLWTIFLSKNKIQ